MSLLGNIGAATAAAEILAAIEAELAKADPTNRAALERLRDKVISIKNSADAQAGTSPCRERLPQRWPHGR